MISGYFYVILLDGTAYPCVVKSKNLHCFPSKSLLLFIRAECLSLFPMMYFIRISPACNPFIMNFWRHTESETSEDTVGSSRW